MILQFGHPVNEEIVSELYARGAYVVGAVPDFGVMVSVDDKFSLEGLGVELAVRLETSDKVSPLLEKARSSADTWVVAEFFPDVDPEDARHLAEAAGFQVQSHPDLIKTHLLLSGSRDRLTGLAQWDEVA